MDKYKFGYEENDKKIIVDIFGLEFEIKEISKNDVEEIKDNKDDSKKMDIFIEKFLGDNAIEKINQKRKEDGHEEMNLTVKVSLLAFVVQTYFNEMSKKVNGIYNSFDNLKNMAGNREQRRYNKYNKNYRR